MNTFKEIFSSDIRGICRSKFAVLVMVGLVLIPCTYAWFNIYASWNPYGNTSELKVAVACEDSGTRLLGTDINIGDEVINELKEDHNLDWTFVDSPQDVIDGVTSAEYYAGVVIPADYSKNFISITTDNVVNPSIEYYVNQKINPISPIITSEGMSELQTIINSTFIQMSSDVALDAINNIKDSNGGNLMNSVSDNTTQSIDLIINSIDAFKNGTMSLDSLINSINATMPYLESSLSGFTSGINAANSAISNLSSANSSIISLLSSISSDLPAQFSQVSSYVSSAFNLANTTASNAVTALSNAKGIISDTISKNESLITTLSVFEQQFPNLAPQIQALISNINNTNSLLSNLSSNLDLAIEQINQTGSITADLQNNITADISDISNSLTSNVNYFNTNVSPYLSASLNDASNTFSSATASINNGAAVLPQISTALSYASDSAQYAANGLNSLENVLIDIQSNIKNLQSDLSNISNSDTFALINDLLENNPDTVAAFFASPVTINTNNIFPVDNFGSAMSPFYTSLAIWVGGLFLVAILKTDLSEVERFRNCDKRKLFFSRLLLFSILCFAQALIVSLGDLFILNCYCVHPVQFVLVCLFTSLVFCSIMFCLTDVFGNIGKAIAVLIMVFQVAGSGGTYPIEITQPVFTALQKLMPFTYSMGAMRETVGGIYAPAYTKDLIVLFIYMAITFLIAYICKPKFYDLKHRLEKKMSNIGIG